MKLMSIAAAAALVFAASSCVDYEFGEQDLDLRYDAGKDVAEFTLETRGIYVPRAGGNREKELANARDRIRQIAAGRRYFYVLGWPLVFDLDAKDGGDETIEDPDVARLFALFDDIAKEVAVLECGAFLDDAGEVATSQRVRVPRARELVDAINGFITLSVLDEIDPNEGADEEAEWGPAKQLLRTHAQSGRKWLTLDGDGLTIHLPIRPEDRGEVLRRLLPEGDGGDHESRDVALLRAVLSGVDSIHTKGDVVHLHYAFGDEGAIELRYRLPRHEMAGEFRAQFAAGELVPRDGERASGR